MRNGNVSTIMAVLEGLRTVPITMKIPVLKDVISVLKELKKHKAAAVKEAAKRLVREWKTICQDELGRRDKKGGQEKCADRIIGGEMAGEAKMRFDEQEYPHVLRAVATDNIRAVRWAMSCGADVDHCSNERNSTLLHQAAKFGRLSIAKFLVSKQANRKLCNALGQTAREVALERFPHHFELHRTLGLHLRGFKSTPAGIHVNRKRCCGDGCAESASKLICVPAISADRADISPPPKTKPPTSVAAVSPSPRLAGIILAREAPSKAAKVRVVDPLKQLMKQAQKARQTEEQERPFREAREAAERARKAEMEREEREEREDREKMEKMEERKERKEREEREERERKEARTRKRRRIEMRGKRRGEGGREGGERGEGGDEGEGGDNLAGDDVEPAKVFIGNLSFQTTDRDLRSDFEQFGDIVDVFLPKDKFSGHRRGFAFITFDDPRDAEDAVDDKNGSDIDGRTVAVSTARPRGRSGSGMGRAGASGAGADS
jgi:hypothetical protein